MLELRKNHVFRSLTVGVAWLPATFVASLLLVALGWLGGCGGTSPPTGDHAPLPPGPPALGGEDDAEVVENGLPGARKPDARARK